MAGTALLTSPYDATYMEDDEASAALAKQAERAKAERVIEATKAVVGNLERIALERVGQRQPRELQWIADLKQYWAQYDEETMTALRDSNNSRLYWNYTRQKTDAMTARMQDLLMPNDDRNWGIGPTPVPSLTDDATKAAVAATKLIEQAKQANADVKGDEDAAGIATAQALEKQRDIAQAKSDELARQVEEGRKRAEAMQTEIDDQLKESNYNAVCRDVLEDGCKLGTGIAKGPITGDRVRKGWKKQQDGAYKLKMSDGEQPQPSMRHVSIWSYFPDMSVRSPSEGMGDMERHLLNKKGLRALADLPGFDKDAISRLLRQNPRADSPTYLASLRNLTSAAALGETNIAGGNVPGGSTTNKFYHVWEYTGPLEEEDMRTLAEAINDPDERNQMIADLDDRDVLDQLNAIVWFCDGEVLKFAIYPFDSGESMYSVFNLCKDEASIFGYGVPFLIADPQAGLNSAYRALLDNMGLGTGPQVVVDTKSIAPVDGEWELTARKLWAAKDGIAHDRRPFETFNIEMHVGEIVSIIELMKQTIDEMAGLPALAQGEQGSNVTKTAQGMTLLQNASNVVFRRYVKNFDDDFTVPTLRRFYDWNMQHSAKEEIKGDYCVDARGSSVLLAREMQATNLTVIIDRFGQHPVFGPMLKSAPLLRKLFQAMMIPTAEVVYTDDEIKIAQDALAKAQQEGPPEDPNLAAEREMRIELANQERNTAIELATIKRDTELIRAATMANVTLDKMANDLEKVQAQLASKERLFAGEIAVERTMGSGGGSGGYISAGKAGPGGQGAPAQQPANA